MHKNFLSGTKQTATAPVARSASTPPNPEREPVQIFVIGSSEGVTNIIHSLYSLRFAQVSEWSPFISAPTPGKLMRVLIRYIAKE